MRNRHFLFVAAAAVMISIAGCGGGSGSGKSPTSATPKAEVNPAGDIPDSQVYVAFTPPSGGYSVKVPEGWARSSSGKSFIFTDKLNSVRVEPAAGSTAPTVAAARTTDVASLRTSVPGFHLISVTSVSRPAGKAVLIKYTTIGKADAVTGKRSVDAVEQYTFLHAGKRLVLTLSGAKGADNVDPWRIVSSSLRWTK
jgi:hypothetical protein